MTREEMVEAIVRQAISEAGPAPNELLAEIARGVFLPIARLIVASGVPYCVVSDGKAIMCLACGAISHNPHDVEQRYCAACHKFHEPGQAPY